jgi:hypothetical protein
MRDEKGDDSISQYHNNSPARPDFDTGRHTRMQTET